MAPSAAEMLAEKVFVHRFDQDVEAKVAAIQLHKGVRDARGGQTGIAKEARGHILREIAAVLAGIVQEELAHAGVPLSRHEFIKANGKARLFIQGAKAAHSFEMDGDVGEGVGAFFDGGAHVLPIVLLESFKFRPNDLDFESANSA